MLSSPVIEILGAPAQFAPARVEKLNPGFRLKRAEESHVRKSDPKPDVTFHDIAVPRDGIYDFRMQVRNEIPGSFCLLKLAGEPYRRIVLARGSFSDGSRCIGFLPLKKGKNTIGLVLPEGGEITALDCRPAGTAELPPEVKSFRTGLRPAGRPRLLLTPPRLERIRRNLNDPEMRRALMRVCDRARGRYELKFVPGRVMEFQAALQEKLLAQAFLAQVDHDPELSRKTAQTMFRYFSELSGFPGTEHFRDIGSAIFAAAIVYDWCYQDFSPEERKLMIRSFYRLAARMETMWPPFRIPVTDGPGNEGAVTIAELAFGVACYEEDPEPFRLVACRVERELVPLKAYEYTSPLHPQGSDYGPARLRADIFCAAVLRIACGKEVFDRNIYSVPACFQKLDLPGNDYFKEGDRRDLSRSRDLGWCFLFACDAVRDPALKGYYLGLGLDREVPLLHMLLNDPGLKAVPPGLQTLPWSTYFGPFHGCLLARTGFNSDEAAVYCIGGRRHNGGHAHCDAGSFQIYYRGMLASDIGEYTLPGSCFNRRSIAHNMLRVFDREETSVKSGNDGGSRPVKHSVKSPDDYEWSPEFKYGENRSISIGPDKMRPAYSVMVSDLASAYSGKIGSYLRFFVFLNQHQEGQPASFIVMDLVESSKAEFPKIFQISTLRKPEIKAGFIGLSTVDGGRADVNFYLPLHAKITGYAGKDALRNPLTGYTDPVLSVSGGSVRSVHRIEVTPSVSDRSDTFLAHFGIRSGKADPLKQEYTDLGNAHGIRTGRFMVILPKKAEFFREPVRLTVPSGGLQVLCVYPAPGPWHAGDRNFTVRKGENTLFMDAPAGILEIVPGRQACVPDYRPPEKCTPPEPAQIPRIRRDGKEVHGRVIFEGGGPYLPYESFPELPKLSENTSVVKFHGMKIPVKPALRRIHGELYVSGAFAAGLLHSRLQTDFLTERVHMIRLPKTLPAVPVAESPVSPEDLMSALYQTGKDGWNAPWDKARFSLIFDRAVMLGGVDITYRGGSDPGLPVMIEVSADGVNFHKVFAGTSSSGERVSAFRWKPEKVRVLRYLGSDPVRKKRTIIERIDFPEAKERE